MFQEEAGGRCCREMSPGGRSEISCSECSESQISDENNWHELVMTELERKEAPECTDWLRQRTGCHEIQDLLGISGLRVMLLTKYCVLCFWTLNLIICIRQNRWLVAHCLQIWNVKCECVPCDLRWPQALEIDVISTEINKKIWTTFKEKKHTLKFTFY